LISVIANITICYCPEIRPMTHFQRCVCLYMAMWNNGIIFLSLIL